MGRMSENGNQFFLTRAASFQERRGKKEIPASRFLGRKGRSPQRKNSL